MKILYRILFYTVLLILLPQFITIIITAHTVNHSQSNYISVLTKAFRAGMNSNNLEDHDYLDFTFNSDTGEVLNNKIMLKNVYDSQILHKQFNWQSGKTLSMRKNEELFRGECFLTTNNMGKCIFFKNDTIGYEFEKYLKLVLATSIISTMITAIIFFFLMRKVLEPLTNLATYISSKGSDNYDFIFKFDSMDEVGILIDKIRAYTCRLKKYKEETTKNACLVSIGQSTAMVAHDVRKPLASMKSLLTVLPSIKDNPLEVEKMITAVDDNIRRTNTMLNDILEFSRDSTALKLDNHNPQSIITSALSEAFRVHPNSDIKVSYNLQHKDYLRVDGDRIIRVLVNIIDNALDAMTNGDRKAKGKIWIETCRSSVVGSRSQSKTSDNQGVTTDERRATTDEFIVITIGNDGPPIPDDVVGKLFDPFFTHGKKGGTGLGLAICRKVIEMHGGRIEARNRDVIAREERPKQSQGDTGIATPFGLAMTNRSVEFTIELPATEGNLAINEAELIYNSSEFKAFHREEAARPEISDITTMAEFMRINKERGRFSYILIVDDEPLFRETVRSLLNNLEQVRDHVKVVEAGSAEEALKLLEDCVTPFDYVITDIDMGKLRMNGYEFAQVVLEKYPNTYVLIHSNKRKDELDQQIRQIANCRHCEERSDEAIPLAPRDCHAPSGLAMTTGVSRMTHDAIRTTRFMGFLPKPMKSSELLQFLACKTFETRNQNSEVRIQKSEPENARQETKMKKVLVVNDDESQTFSIGFTLKNYNVQVLTASNVSEALTHLTNSNVDIILSDINLGNDKPSGYDLLKKVREDKKDTPFYFMSGYSKSEQWPKAKDLGANGYLQIPIEDEELEKIL